MLQPEDYDQIAEHGVTADEVRRQIELFAHPPRPVEIDRPCTCGDGIRILSAEEEAACERAYDDAARRGRLSKLVPASGAATRMFKSLLRFRSEPAPLSRAEAERRAAGGDSDAEELVRFLDGLSRFAFYDELLRTLGVAELRRSELDDGELVRRVLEQLLGPAGLDYASLPKGLLAFHRYTDGSRTAFEEHLVEATDYVRDAAGVCRLHFTVSPEHLDRFRAALEAACARYEKRYGARFEVDFSLQKPSTDTVAVDPQNRPFRTGDGRLLFRPGGHGALIENLNDLQADVILVKNIDNVVPDRLKAPSNRWKKILAGCLVSLQREIFSALQRLGSSSPKDGILGEVVRFAEERLLIAPPRGSRLSRAELRKFLLRKLDRPLRVCAMVRNVGEPGGGPFWVHGADGVASLQIVESAQVDPHSEEQRRLFASATHFNPVDMVCGVRDRQDRCFELPRYVDPTAVFISEKSYDGRPLKALERPGLWNGAMADWITVFVEMPLLGFAPVKSVNDLLRAEHQPEP